MNIGDLVRCDIGSYPADEGCRVGVITGFDEDDDPIVCYVCYYNETPITEPFYRHHVEVIDETI